MKRCPKCNQIYTDETLSFCLSDGTALIFEGEQQTVVLQKTPPRKTNKILYVVLGIIGLIFLAAIGVVVAAFLIYYNNKPAGNSVTQTQNTAKSSPSPTVSSSPKTSPTATATATPTSSPKSEETKTDDTIEEITPILWTTTVTSFKWEEGQKYKFECPPNGTESIIWGSDVYTADSSICTAAVHAGLITLADGGIVTAEYRPGRQIYGSTTRNGITSKNYGEYPKVLPFDNFKF